MGNEDYSYGYTNAHLAEHDGVVAGSIIDYKMKFEGAKPSFGPIADPVLKSSFKLRASVNGHWYVDCLAIYSQSRDKGIGRLLLESAWHRANLKWICDTVAQSGGTTVIPSRSNRKNPEPIDDYIYALRNQVERCFNKLKCSRRLATRYDKTTASYLGFIHIVSTRLWFRSLST